MNEIRHALASSFKQTPLIGNKNQPLKFSGSASVCDSVFDQWETPYIVWRKPQNHPMRDECRQEAWDRWEAYHALVETSKEEIDNLPDSMHIDINSYYDMGHRDRAVITYTDKKGRERYRVKKKHNMVSQNRFWQSVLTTAQRLANRHDADYQHPEKTTGKKRLLPKLFKKSETLVQEKSEVKTEKTDDKDK